MTNETKAYIDEHRAGDKRRYFVLAWVCGLLVVVGIVSQIVVYSYAHRVSNLSHNLQNAQCTIVAVLESSASRETKLAEVGRDTVKRVPPVNKNQRILRQRSIETHERNATSANDIATRLRQDVNCPPPLPAP